MTTWKPVSRLATIVAAALCCVDIAVAGLGDTPLPLFADASPSVEVARLSGVVNRFGAATVALCSNLGTSPAHVGLEVFDDAGLLQNDIQAGEGAVLSVAHGATATISTSATSAFLETSILVLPASFTQGSARVVASSRDVRCSLMIADDGLTPPQGLASLREAVALAAGPWPASVPLPQFSDGHAAVASAPFPGAVSRDSLETAVFCTSLAAGPVDIGVELLSSSGSAVNSVLADNGAAIGVAPGATVTFGSTGTAALLETEVVVIVPDVAQGIARVVADSTQVACSAVTLDSVAAPAAAMTELLPAGSFSGVPAAHPAPVPDFSDSKPALEVALVPGVTKRDSLQTLFFCSSLATSPVNVAVEVFSRDGTLLNDIGAGVGEILSVAPGATVTFATSATAAYLESEVIPLVNGLQGSARILASDAGVSCTAVIVDDVLSPPTSVATLAGAVQPSPGIAPGSAPLPTFASGRTATHAAWFPGLTKRSDVETDVFCTSVAPARIDVGLQVFTPAGAVANDVGAGNGAVLGVAPGETIAFGTTGSAAFFESEVVVLPGIAQGLGRVVSTSGDLVCGALVLDQSVSPPSSFTSLEGVAASCGDGVAELGEQCDGADATACPGSCGADCRCPASCGDGFVQAGEDCDDGNATGGDCCSASCALECDDGNPCTRDFCEAPAGTCTNDATPVEGCMVAARSIVQFKKGTTSATDKMKWVWTSGPAVTQDDLGDPSSTTTYTLCVADTDGGTGVAATTLTLPPSSSWIDASPSGWTYSDKSAANDGVSSLQIRTGAAGRSKLKMKAGGSNLPMPTPVGATFFHKDPEVAVQLFNDETGACWSSSFAAALANDALRFKAKAP